MKSLSILIFIFCLFSFKFDILGEIRIDDLLVFILGVITINFLFIKRLVQAKEFLNKSIILFSIFASFNIASALYNFIAGRIDIINGLLFSIRHLEYFLFIFLGYILSYYKFDFRFWLKVYLIFIIALIPLQSYGLFPVFSGFSPDRAIGNAGGPWEMAAIAAFLFFYFLEYRHLYFSLASFAVILLTESRITLAATLISFLLNFSHSLLQRRLFFFFLLFSTFATNGTLGFLLLPDQLLPSIPTDVNLINRVTSFFNHETIDFISNTLNSTTIVTTSDEFLNLTLGEKLNFELETADGDPSAIVRFTNWAILLMSTLESIDSVIIGLGPSFAGKAVDGGFVRLFVETGVCGVAIYTAFIISVLTSTRSRLIFYYLLTLSISAIFIDIFTTYKAMFLFWVFYGQHLHLNKTELIKNCSAINTTSETIVTSERAGAHHAQTTI